MRLSALSLALALALPVSAAEPPAKKPLTLESVSAMPPSFGALSGTAWRDAGHLTWIAREGEGEKATTALWEWDVAAGKKTKILDPIPVPLKPEDKEKDKANGKDEKEKEKEKTPRTLPLAGAAWNKAGTQLLLSGEKDLWLYDLAGKALTRLTEDADEEEYPTFSPDGRKVAFVKKNDLFVLDVATREAAHLTTSGSETILNGKLDWVYEEELAGRGQGRGYEWSPDSRAIVYLQLDESPVPEYPIVDFLPTNGKLEPQRYPKAGEPNPIPSVHLVELPGGASRVVKGIRYKTGDLLVFPEFSFTPDGKAACYLAMDRTQNKVEVVLVPREGESRTILTETDPAWINVIQPPRFLPDGTFLFLSERSGYCHAYRYSQDGKLLNAVTKGDWMIDRTLDVDEKGGWVWLVATEKDPRERHVYRVKIDGTGFVRLTNGRGTHGFLLSPDGKRWVDSYSDATTPSSATLRDGKGTQLAVLAEPKNRLADFVTGTVELGSFRGKDGTLFYTKLVRPSDFDPAKKYPVVVEVYGGPHAQMVRDSWGAASGFHHLLASKGYLVFSVDGRGSWGRGHAFETAILKHAGAQELADQLAGVAWLKSQPYVDGTRIGITGWSYGGYMSVYAATHAGSTFRCAVAGAPVTDWKFYDSIYTERYMKLPKENADGYKAASVLESAKDLGTRLLILHGTSDDNVHMQNTIAFADAAARARKDFDFVPLARQKHGPRDPAMRLYTNQRILEFLETNLK